MRWGLVVAVAVVGTNAHATDYFGTAFANPHVVRVGTSANADISFARFELLWDANVALRAVYWHTGTVHTPGSWSLDLEGQVATITLAENDWNVFIPSAPLYGSANLVITPIGSAESDFVVMMGYQNLPQYGYRNDSLQPNLWPSSARVIFLTVGQGATLVMELDGADALADPACVDAGRVVGWPYVAVEEVTVPAGGSISQSGWFLPQTPSETAYGAVDLDFVFPIGSATVLAELESPGALTRSVTMLRPRGVHVFDSPALLPMYTGGLAPMRLTAHPMGGSVAFKRLSARRDAGVCDPIIRATWGGANGNSGQIDSDLSFAVFGCAPVRLYDDADRDGYGNPDASDLYCNIPYSPLPTPRAANTADCDDTNARRSPDAGEECNGVDDDCDGQLDALDTSLRLSRCEIQVGACLGSTHHASECQDGGWAACSDLATRSAQFEAVETRCDGVDNDCDKLIDEGALHAPLCIAQLGVCAGTRPLTCSQGVWSSCGRDDLPATWEAPERSCDGLDNDCDGRVDLDDSDLQNVAHPCELRKGVCVGAVHPLEMCTATGWARCGNAEYGPSYQIEETACDALDNDCDGIVDEGCAPSCSSCSMTGIDALLWMSLLLARRLSRRPSATAALAT